MPVKGSTSNSPMSPGVASAPLATVGFQTLKMAFEKKRKWWTRREKEVISLVIVEHTVTLLPNEHCHIIQSSFSGIRNRVSVLNM